MAANTYLTPTTIARAALSILRRTIVLPNLVWRQVEADFGPGLGATVNVRGPATLTGGGSRTYTQTLRDAGTEMIFDNGGETSIPVTIDTMLYKGVKVTDEDLTMNLRDFGAQVLAPQVQVVSEGIENYLAAIINGVTAVGTVNDDGSDLFAKIIDARQRLNANHVSMTGRVLVLSPEVEALLLLDPDSKLVPYTATGQTGTPALREATIGRLYGFDVVTSSLLTAGSMAAFVPEAFAFVNVAPANPEGATFSRSVAESGLALRYLRDYDPRFAQDRSLVSSFCGGRLMDINRVMRYTATTPAP